MTTQTYYHSERPIVRATRNWDWLFPDEIIIDSHTYPATPDHECVALPFLRPAKVCRECGEPPIHMFFPLDKRESNNGSVVVSPIAPDSFPTIHCCKCDREREWEKERMIKGEKRTSDFEAVAPKLVEVKMGGILDTWETAPEELY